MNPLNLLEGTWQGTDSSVRTVDLEKNEESGFSARKSPKEGERVALGHFHERVGERPRSDETVGTSGCKIRRFVSEIWPFEVGIGVTADFTM